MVYKYKRHTERASWSESAMQAAMKAMIERDKMSNVHTSSCSKVRYFVSNFA